jgi:hypothetical protein
LIEPVSLLHLRRRKTAVVGSASPRLQVAFAPHHCRLVLAKIIPPSTIDLQRPLQRAVLVAWLSPAIPLQQLLGTLGEHTTNLPPLPFDPRDHHSFVAGRLVTHPSDDGGFRPSSTGIRSILATVLLPTGLAVGDGTGQPVGQMGVKGEESYHRPVEILDVFGLRLLTIPGGSLLLLGVALFGPLGVQFGTNPLDRRRRRLDAPGEHLPAHLLLHNLVITGGLHPTGETCVPWTEESPAVRCDQDGAVGGPDQVRGGARDEGIVVHATSIRQLLPQENTTILVTTLPPLVEELKHRLRRLVIGGSDTLARISHPIVSETNHSPP